MKRNKSGSRSESKWYSRGRPWQFYFLLNSCWNACQWRGFWLILWTCCGFRSWPSWRIYLAPLRWIGLLWKWKGQILSFTYPYQISECYLFSRKGVMRLPNTLEPLKQNILRKFEFVSTFLKNSGKTSSLMK